MVVDLYYDDVENHLFDEDMNIVFDYQRYGITPLMYYLFLEEKETRVFWVSPKLCVRLNYPEYEGQNSL